MVVHGTFRNGVVVPERPAEIPEGQRVQIVFQKELAQKSSVTQKLLKLAGTVNSGHTDASRNHDHYLYGAPKREPES